MLPWPPAEWCDGGVFLDPQSGRKLAGRQSAASAVGRAIVEGFLCIVDRYCLVAACKHTRSFRQLPLPTTVGQGVFSPKRRRHRHPRIEVCALLFSFSTHVSGFFGPVSPWVIHCPKTGSAAQYRSTLSHM
jgi:hypothetical protein